MASTSPWYRASIMIAIAGLLVLDAIALRLMNIRIDPGSGTATSMQVASFLSIIILARIYPIPLIGRVQDAFILCYLFAGLSLAGTLAQYWVAGSTHGYYDSVIAAIDLSLGFDWVALYRWTAATPWASALGKTVYCSIFASPLLIIIGLTLAGQTTRAERFILATAMGMVGTLAIFAIIPTQCALSYYIGDDNFYRPVTDMTYIGIFEALRAGEYDTIPLNAMSGFVSFPSFHAVSASLMIWASWRQRWIAWPFVTINIAMLLATPVEGSHYLTDIIAGIVLAAACIVATKPLMAWIDRRTLIPPKPLLSVFARAALPTRR